MSESETRIRILAVGAHPDDIEFGVGGILLQEHAAGAEIFLAVTSNGESGSYGTPENRVAEATASAAMIGAADRLTFLDFGGDGKQSASVDHTTRLARLIREVKPDVVVAPALTPNQHPDHAIVSGICRDACRIARYSGFLNLAAIPVHTVNSLWYYSITPAPELSLVGAVLIDISQVYSIWIEMMHCHRSQTRNRSYVDLQTSRSRQLGLMAGCEHAIALWPNDPPVLHGIRPVSRTARGF